MNDLENTYHWLTKDQPCFPYALRVLVARMHAEAEAGNYHAAWNCLQELRSTNGVAGRLEKALVRLECAWAAGKMHNRNQAYEEIKEAINLLGQQPSLDPRYEHAYAIACWMKGVLKLSSSNPFSVVRSTWQKSLEAFKHLIYHPDTLMADQIWYTDRFAEMNQGIADAVDGYIYRPFLPQAILQSGRLGSITVYDKIYTGSQGPLPPPVHTEELDLQPSQEEFWIGEQPYHFYNLRGERRIVNLASDQPYFALKISDKSLDKIGICPGDYVLVRSQEEAKNGDIAVCQAFPDDKAATLRLYLTRRNAVVLQPQSSNPEQRVFEFTSEAEREFNLYGVVLGVFKQATRAAAIPEPIQPAREAESRPATETKESAQPIGDIAESIPIYASIPASPPGTPPEQSDSFLEMDRFWIDERPYCLRNLRGKSRVVNLRSDHEVIVLKVTGDSMNLAGIENGDYVLLRWQDTADDGDIIAAKIQDVATLKRYTFRNGKVILRPESSNPDHKEFPFDPSKLGTAIADQDFQICGIVLAVLKPFLTPG